MPSRHRIQLYRKLYIVYKVIIILVRIIEQFVFDLV